MTSSDDVNIWQRLHDESVKVLEEQAKRKEHELLQSMRNPEDREPYPGDEEPDFEEGERAMALTPEPGLEKGDLYAFVARNDLPTRYGRCTCECHVYPIKHITACCGPWTVTSDGLQHNPPEVIYNEGFDIEEATKVILDWIDYYNSLKMPHIREIYLHRKLVDMIEELQDNLGEPTE